MTSRNWVLTLVGVEILWEEEGFQFGFKRWQGQAVSKVLGVNSKCGVQSKRKCESHESCVCIAGFSVCRCQKSVVYETEWRHVAGPELFSALKHIQTTLYLMQCEMGSQCSFSRRGTEWWLQGAKRTSLAAKFWIFWIGWMMELGVPITRQLQ